MKIIALQKQGPVHSASEGFLCQVLFLVFLEVCTKIQLFHKFLTPEHCLCVWCFLVLSQLEYVSQDWTTALTELGLQGRQSCLGGAGL